jgi:hypothetical protein
VDQSLSLERLLSFDQLCCEWFRELGTQNGRQFPAWSGEVVTGTYDLTPEKNLKEMLVLQFNNKIKSCPTKWA